MRYTVNRSKVVLEHFDDETILINMQTCVYYSLNRSGCDVWKLVEAGHDAATITQTLFRRHGGDQGAIAGAVASLFTELVTEGLLEPLSDETAAHLIPAAPPAEADLPSPQSLEPFVAPSLSRYHDMQELLLLDPIHDVDASGWPNARPQALAGSK